MPAGAARNALDCAFWDLAAKRSRTAAARAGGAARAGPVTTAYTISLAEPAIMAQAAEKRRHRALLKIKLGAEGRSARIAPCALPRRTQR